MSYHLKWNNNIIIKNIGPIFNNKHNNQPDKLKAINNKHNN